VIRSYFGTATKACELEDFQPVKAQEIEGLQDEL
jgi:peptidoglycan hydrolase CwlO-like protein